MISKLSEYVKETFSEMADLEPAIEVGKAEANNEVVSLGVSSIISFTGKLKGRILLDLPEEFALKLTELILEEKFATVRERMVLETAGEINNIIGGKFISDLNNSDKSFKLVLATPIMFSGKNVYVCMPKFKSQNLLCGTKYGDFLVNLALEGGK